MLELLTLTTLLMTTLLLLLPLLMKPLKNKIPLMVKMAFFMSIIPTTMIMKMHMQTINISLPTTNMGTLNMTMLINKNLTLFLPIALLVTWSIMQFSTWYMTNEPTNKFQKLLLIFLISMLILVSSGNLMQLMVGWEGVGILSFMLINWWSGRTNANSAALQAIIYNRIGDTGLILVLVTTLSDLGTWNMLPILSSPTKNTLITLGLILAATGKSAQFFMHMWLPSAMEGPTPVSALLHSSTMVVAGVYLLAHMHPAMNTNLTTTTCLFLGTATSIYSAACAISQNDIKKIIAFSTSSQLGLMMVAIGINQPNLAIFHMVTHATFKSSMFLCSGSIIHNTSNEQDIRKTNCIKTTLPITSTLMTMNGLALAGVPFLSGFFSKDMIVETLLSTHNNAWALNTTMIATTMTSSYTMRMIIYMTKKFYNGTPVMKQHENSSEQIMPLIRLTTAAIILGAGLTLTITLSQKTMNQPLKLLPLLAIITGTYLATNLTAKPKTKTDKSLKFMNQLAFYNITHRSMPLTILRLSYKMTTQLTDLIWLEKIAPMTIDKSNQILTTTISTQKGQMKNYFILLLMTLSLSLLCFL
uniref:NADH-ubiquinone oxidoreductase chain 5 n=1 Tax=Xenagama taylori TaxID=330728 RepID=Q1G7J3_9SAUR|nr:NADH dehydrogenase subunit 5 [Xenagama taylori]AAY57828.1 NADH dehydrogenase subunit 5 [Xenagama taylori]